MADAQERKSAKIDRGPDRGKMGSFVEAKREFLIQIVLDALNAGGLVVLSLEFPKESSWLS